MTGPTQKDFFLETREIKEMENSKSQSPDFKLYIKGTQWSKSDYQGPYQN